MSVPGDQAPYAGTLRVTGAECSQWTIWPHLSLKSEISKLASTL